MKQQKSLTAKLLEIVILLIVANIAARMLISIIQPLLPLLILVAVAGFIFKLWYDRSRRF